MYRCHLRALHFGLTSIEPSEYLSIFRQHEHFTILLLFVLCSKILQFHCLLNGRRSTGGEGKPIGQGGDLGDVR